MDISSDLTELARTPVAVVCAGAKSVSLGASFDLCVLVYIGSKRHSHESVKMRKIYNLCRFLTFPAH